MKLLIDVGNTRLKACVSASELYPLAAISDVPSLEAWLREHGASVSEVGMASVASAQIKHAVLTVLRQFVAEEHIYCATYDASLLLSCYAQPQRLGIDRWLALLPFRQSACCVVVDAGTAFTLDVVFQRQHIGGYILPGLRLQREVLAQQTAAVSFPHAKFESQALGLETATCVGHGSLRALTALTHSVMAEYRDFSPQLIVTGGDASYFAPALAAQWRPLIVFEGLVIAMNHQAGSYS